MKKKLQIIVAFALESKLLIVDEPFRGLDVESIIITKQLIKKYVEKGSILLCSHDLALIEELSDEVIMLYKGNVIAKGTSYDLKTKFESSNLEEVFMKIFVSRFYFCSHQTSERLLRCLFLSYVGLHLR